ncbi:GNAT family N-acetyltransferase [Nocardia panacis]|uniref:GNAT family N-acetyltransferase n=1 Tax=Nocardia panacis TaxID=2340916 RepID=A0A3A4KCH9_9NOCA|nr:GNAT family N-acetyltransferase [Nocardia panacis]RJO77958.1 GNAT family N-acetyltransferase [Nocardia panacis]
MTVTGHDTVIYRAARPEDAAAMNAIDDSFSTNMVLTVTSTDSGFVLSETRIDPPVRKKFPDDGQSRDEDPGDTMVAVADRQVCGFVTTEYEAWNRRLTIVEIRVAPTHRGRGIGHALLDQVMRRARELGAGHVWLEVTNVNVPAIRLYRKAGFAFCGLDTSLYTTTESAGETALFMSRSC